MGGFNGATINNIATRYNQPQMQPYPPLTFPWINDVNSIKKIPTFTNTKAPEILHEPFSLSVDTSAHITTHYIPQTKSKKNPGLSHAMHRTAAAST